MTTSTLLKVSAEGSEYEILEHVVKSDIDVRVSCVEYAQPAGAEKAQESVNMLQRAATRWWPPACAPELEADLRRARAAQ